MLWDIPWEASHFCRYFLNHGGKLEGRVQCRKYRWLPIPKLSFGNLYSSH